MHLASPSRTIKQKAFTAGRCVGSTENNAQHRSVHTSGLGSRVVPVLTRGILNRCYLAQLKESSFVGSGTERSGHRLAREKGAHKCLYSVRRCQSIYLYIYLTYLTDLLCSRWHRLYDGKRDSWTVRRDLYQHTRLCPKTAEKRVT